MFDRKDIYKDPFEKLVKTFGNVEKGDFIPYEKICQATGYSKGTKKGDYLIQKFKRWLTQQKVVWRCESGAGIQILSDNEACRRVPAERLSRSINQLNRGGREIGTIDTANLSELQQRRLLAVQGQLKTHRRFLKRARREFQNGPRVTEVNPKRR